MFCLAKSRDLKSCTLQEGGNGEGERWYGGRPRGVGGGLMVLDTAPMGPQGLPSERDVKF